MVTLGSLVLGSATSALADSPVSADRPPSRGWLTLDPDRDQGLFSLGLVMSNLAMPRWGLNGDSASHRLVGVAAPPNAAWFYGMKAGVTARVGSLIFEFAEVSYQRTAGGSSLDASANGETVQVSRSELHKVDVAFLGVGMQAISPSGKAKLAMKTDWGWSTMWGYANANGAGDKTSGVIGDQHWFVRAEVAACARANLRLTEDSRSWGCLTGSTNVYEEDAWLNGFNFGVRADF
jgi:hypothetical protein